MMAIFILFSWPLPMVFLRLWPWPLRLLSTKLTTFRDIGRKINKQFYSQNEFKNSIHPLDSVLCFREWQSVWLLQQESGHRMNNAVSTIEE
jgi:hypothetical protein